MHPSSTFLLTASALLFAASAQASDARDAARDAAGLEAGAVAPLAPASASATGGGYVVGPATPVSVDVVLQDGDTPAGAPLGETVSTLNAPFTDSTGKVGFVGALTPSSDRFIWYDTGIVFLSSSAAATLTGGEGTMGISDTAGFIYSPSINGGDGVWSQNGEITSDGAQAPGFPPGVTTTFASRPTMRPDGRAHWVGGINSSGGTSTEDRVLYTSSDATMANAVPFLTEGDLVAGLPVLIIQFSYDFSDDSTRSIVELDLDTGSSATAGHIVVDGAVVAQEGSPTGGGDNWANFDNVSINGAGNHIFSGDTDGSTATDEFLAYNGAIALREGDSVAGVVLGSAVDAASINEAGAAAFVWDIDGGGEGLFYACDASDLSSAVLLLRVGDMVDVGGDGVADATVTDFEASNGIGPGIDLATDGRVFVEVELDYGAGNLEAVIGLDVPAVCSSFSTYCSGDGSATACPCGNTGATGAGCENSFSTGGALLGATGDASVSADTVVLACAGMGPTAPGLYFQGTAQQNGGLGDIFGDGLRCVSGTVIRLKTQVSVGGASIYPDAGDPAISVKGMLPPGGGTRYYQVWYRNVQAFCTSATFNLSNAVQIDWQP